MKRTEKDVRELRDCELMPVVGGAGALTAGSVVDHALSAVGMPYVYGGRGPQGFDSVGLITSLTGRAGTTEMLLAEAPEKGPMSTMPEIPGLGLYSFGFVGVYVGGNMCVCALNESEGVVRVPVSMLPWSMWFKIGGVSY